MIVTITIEGGLAFFPGLQAPRVFDTRKLPAEEARTLKKLLRSTDFFALPAEANAPQPGAADYRTYVVTVEVGERKHTVRVHDPVGNDALDRLIQFLSRPPPATKVT